MLLIAVHDRTGVIIGAVLADGEHPTPVPLAPEGFTVARIKLTDEQARRPLDELCTSSRVDAHSNTLTALDKPAAD